MKVALITDGIFPFTIGGIQKHSYYLIKELSKKSINIEVYHSDKILSELLIQYFDDEELKFIKFIFVQTIVLPYFPGHYLIECYTFSRRVFQLIKDKDYEVIYAQGFTSWGFIKNSGLNKRIISNLHGLEMFQISINLINKLKLLFLRWPARIIIKNSRYQISLGGSLTTILKNKGANIDSIRKIPNGISNSWLIQDESHKNQKITFTFIGRNERRKGIVEITKVLKTLINDNLNFQFNFIGLDYSEINIHSSKVKCFGVIRDEDIIKKILSSSDVLICPSFSEGMPTVILEAMACSCAIISTNVGAISELVDNNNGLMINQEKLTESLNIAMREYIKIDKKELDNKKNKSIEKINDFFLWKKVTNEHLNLFKEINSKTSC